MADWYEVVEGDELQQGDFFPSCPIAVPPTTFVTPQSAEPSPEALSEALRVVVRTYNVVVMSQSCDLVQRKLDLVLVCPHWPLSALENVEDESVRNFFRSRKGKEDVRRGYVPAYHMLAACNLEGFQHEIQIVDFRTVFSVPFDFLTELARQRNQRLRLRSPYREHLSQAFARFFMRVGLPADIPPFK
jgi:hypothetical protein